MALTFETRISTGADDGYDNPSYLNTGSYNYVGYSTARFKAFFRFQNVTVPHGAKIVNAYMRAIVWLQYDPPDVAVWCNDEDDAVAPTDRTELEALSHTTAYSNWRIDTPGEGYATDVDVTAQVQEVVNRAGWHDGNALMVLTHYDTNSGDYVALYSYDQDGGSSSRHPLLHIEYVPAGGAWNMLPIGG